MLAVLAGPAVSAATAACPCSLWNDATIPAIETSNDGDAAALGIEVGVKIIPSVDGTITALRFYKGAGNNGPHFGHLWTAGGTPLAAVEFTSETASGWQQVSLPTPIAVTAGTMYVASYHAPTGGYAANGGYFTTSYTNGPLTAPALPDPNGNGVYNYGPSSFPTNSFNSGNYWVDVVFQEAGDTTPPTVTAVSPVDGATDIDVGVHPSATFSEAMDATTITASTVQLSGPGGAVPAGVAYDAGSQTVTLTPNSALASATQYTMTVKGGAGGVADAAGNNLASDRTWSFTTAAPAGPDTTPPTIIGRIPDSGATGIALDAAVVVTFSERLNPVTVTTTSVQLNGPGGGVDATVAYDDAARRVTLTPASPLADSTTYTVLVKGRQKGVADIAGNTLASNSTWSFTTVDLSAPVISAISVTSTTDGTAKVSWSTNEASTSRVDYGTDPASLGQSVSDPALVTAHSISISGLTPGTTYHFRVTSGDAAGNSATSPAPPAAPASFTVASARFPSAVVIENGSLRSGTVGALAAQDASYFRVNSQNPLLGLGSSVTSWYGRFTGVPRPLSSLKVTAVMSNSRSSSQVLQVWRWTTSSWVQVDSRTVGTSDVKVADVAPSGGASDYVSSGGEVRVRVRTTSGSSFINNGNLLQITIA